MIELFFDRVILESLAATFFMSLSMALVGTLCVLKKKSLTGEMMSHASLPGLALTYVFFGGLLIKNEVIFSLLLLLFAWVFCLIFQKISHRLIQEKIPEDATLCLTLSLGLGLGIFFQSLLQKTHPSWFKKLQLFFYGQAATLLWEHVLIYAVLTFFLVCFIFFTHNRLKWFLFDEGFFKFHGIKIKILELMIDWLVAFAIVIGIRSCGVILVSGMLIIPVIAARRWTDSLKKIYLLSCLFASISVIIGNYLSLFLPYLIEKNLGKQLTIALGPLLIIISFSFLFISLIFSPKNGLIFCFFKQIKNQFKIKKENSLKKFWYLKEKDAFSLLELKEHFKIDTISFYLVILNFLTSKVMKKKEKKFFLTKKGKEQVTHIVRIHRLFELYLSRQLHVDLKNVHGIAEELEHVISPDIENELSLLLDYPSIDPHKQPIPSKRSQE